MPLIIAWVSAIATVSPAHFITALTGMMKANEEVLVLEISLIVLSVLLISALLSIFMLWCTLEFADASSVN